MYRSFSWTKTAGPAALSQTIKLEPGRQGVIHAGLDGEENMMHLNFRANYR